MGSFRHDVKGASYSSMRVTREEGSCSSIQEDNCLKRESSEDLYSKPKDENLSIIRPVRSLQNLFNPKRGLISEKSNLTILYSLCSFQSFSIARPSKYLTPYLNKASNVEISKDLPNLLGREKKILSSYRGNFVDQVSFVDIKLVRHSQGYEIRCS